MKTAKRAFTLIEVLAVIAIVALLMGILMPALSKARQLSKRIVCLSNLRQMVIAANTYLINNDGYYPLALFTIDSDVCYQERGWDFVKTAEDGTITSCKPGLLWQGQSALKIQQCPSFKGSTNSPGDPYTGYNYNVSYIGGIIKRTKNGALKGSNSSKALEVRNPANCAIFGDGQWSGANKFMRSPFIGKLDPADAWARPYGTQGYRHLGKTNVVYCDGSASSVGDKYTETYPPLKNRIVDGTGFLSKDNSAYDLK